jgi:cyclase
MSITRRVAVAVATLLLYGGAVFVAHAQRGGGAGAPQTPAPPPTLIKVRPDLFVIQNANHVVAEIGQNGGNVVVYVTDEGVILIDSKNERMHDDIIAKVKSVTDKPIKYMILTHNHGDHSGGSARLQSIGVTVVSSVGARDNMARANQAGAATLAFSGYGQLFLGGKELQLREYRGHTRGDTVISFPAARAIAAGDLVTTPETIPTIVNYGDGGNWSDLGRSLEEVARLDFDTVIGGHGPNLTRADYLKYRDRVIAIRERVRALNRERKSAEEIAATVGKEFNWGTGPAAGNIAGMMQELR